MNDNLLKVLLGWLQNFFSGLQDWMGNGALENLSKHWILWVIILIAAGFLIDKIVYFFRFRPDRRVKEAVRSFRSVMEGQEQEEEKPEEVNAYGYVSYKEPGPEEIPEEEYDWEQASEQESTPPSAADPAVAPSSGQGKIQDRELDPKPDQPVPIGVYHGPRQNVPFGIVAGSAASQKPSAQQPEEQKTEIDLPPAESDSFELENMRDLSQPMEDETEGPQITGNQE